MQFNIRQAHTHTGNQTYTQTEKKTDRQVGNAV